MNELENLPQDVAARLRCVYCRSKLAATASGELRCVASACGALFPMVDGVPVLINESTSVFRLSDFVQRKETTYADFGPAGSARPPERLRKIKQWIEHRLPSLGTNLTAAKNYKKYTDLLLQNSPAPTVLVVGGRELGIGQENSLNPAIRYIESDVTFGSRIALICDGHELPFEDGTFDGVIAQAVLEHVVDPFRCAAEIDRVTKPGGLVYAETPFMQQVHGGRYDFTRFTRRGHRRLFRGFEEIESGAACGPGMALAWSYEYFLLSFATSRPAVFALDCFAKLTGFWLKYFDPYLVKQPRSDNAASGFFFMGRKTGRVLTDSELIKLY